jgi:hypothetical protein
VVKALLAGGADVLIKDSVSTLKLVAVMKDIFFFFFFSFFFFIF